MNTPSLMKQMALAKYIALTGVLLMLSSTDLLAGFYRNSHNSLYYNNNSGHAIVVYWKYTNCSGYNSCKPRSGYPFPCSAKVDAWKKKLLDTASNSATCSVRSRIKRY